jgi:hypothetical protein
VRPRVVIALGLGFLIGAASIVTTLPAAGEGEPDECW